MPRGSRRALYALLTALLVVGVAVLLLTAFFAVRAWRDPFPRVALRLEGDWMLAPDPETGFVPAPGSAVTRADLASGLRYRIYTDRRGARVDGPGEETPPRVAILTVGGSFAHGHGIDNEETFTSRLGRVFGVPVANLAFASFGTVQSVLLLERNLDLEPAVVVYGFIADHLRRNLSPCAPSFSPYCLPVAHVDFDSLGRPFVAPPPMEYFTPEQNRAFFEQVLARDRFSWRDVLWRMRIDLFQLRESARISYRDDPGRRRGALELLVGRMQAAADRAGSQLIVMSIPTPLEPPFAPAPAALAEVAAARGVELLDLAPVFDRLDPQTAAGLEVAPGDGHPNARAHAVMAAELESRIRARGRLADRGPRPASAE